MALNLSDKNLKRLIFAGLSALVAVIFFQQIEFTSLDLGRHLANGREIWNDTGLLWRNFYSYTEPDYPFVNHHWLAGVIYYSLYLLGGFKLLTVWSVLSGLAVFGLAFKLAAKRAGFFWTAALSLPAIFMLSQRTDIRPETFSYIFILLVWLLIEKADEGRNPRPLFWLLPLFALWANIHIYFFIGLALLGFRAAAGFWPPAWHALWSGADGSDVLRTGWRESKLWFRYLGLAALASLANPNTWRGLLYPFNILREYGYQIAENKTVFFLENLSINPNFDLFKLGLVLLVVSFAAYRLVRRRFQVFELLAALFFAGMALFASRNLALFAIVLWIISSRNLSVLNYLGAHLPDSVQKPIWRGVGVGLLGVLIVASFIYLWIDARGRHVFIRQPAGWDLVEGSGDSADFFRASGLGGPVFNNYDLGSALTFWIYPAEKVFVDNRPEAYSVSFFTDIYRPMQEERSAWEKYRREYGIQTIYFSHTDGTPWARNFLRMILNDPAWTLVYFDRYTVILASAGTTDKAILREHGIDQPTFRSRLREMAEASTVQQRFLLASLAEAAGQPDLAVEIYRRALLADPDDVRALVSLGYIYAAGDTNEKNQALNYFERALEAGEVLPGIYNERGLIYWQLGEYQKAAGQWLTALKLERKNASALHYLAELERLRQEGRIPTGEE